MEIEGWEKTTRILKLFRTFNLPFEVLELVPALYVSALT
jgi:hypothetical protein